MVVVSWYPHHRKCALRLLAEDMLYFWDSYFALWNYLFLVVILHGDALHHMDKWLGNENMDSIFFLSLKTNTFVPLHTEVVNLSKVPKHINSHISSLFIFCASDSCGLSTVAVPHLEPSRSSSGAHQGPDSWGLLPCRQSPFLLRCFELLCGPLW